MNMSVIADGYELTFRSPKDESPPIIEYDESSFAHVILFASETKSKSGYSLEFKGPLEFS